VKDAKGHGSNARGDSVGWEPTAWQLFWGTGDSNGPLPDTKTARTIRWDSGDGPDPAKLAAHQTAIAEAVPTADEATTAGFRIMNSGYPNGRSQQLRTFKEGLPTQELRDAADRGAATPRRQS